MATRITTPDLTTASINGTGVFDVLMKASKEHLEQEFQKNRIKGGEYSTVYLGSLTAVLEQAVEFLLNKDKAANEAALIEAQIRLADAQVALAIQQTENTKAEHAILLMGLPKINAEIAHISAQTAMLNAQKDNVAKEGLVLDKQAVKLTADTAQITAQTGLTEQQKANAVLEGKLLVKQELKLIADTELVGIQGTKLTADTGLVAQQTANAVVEQDVLRAQICKLQAEYDVLMQSKAKTAAENSLLTQKTATEKAQITGMGVDEDSVIGRQKSLYQAQSEGIIRDAEQKAAKIMVDTWNVRRTTDDKGTPATSANQLDDTFVGRAVSKLLAGVSA